MSWSMNQGPSFDTQMHAFQKLNGFYQRFNLTQDDNRMTPGKRQPKLPEETMKGTFKLSKRNTRVSRKSKQIKYSDIIPKGQPEPIYSGFGNIKNKATSKIKKSGGKLKRRYNKDGL